MTRDNRIETRKEELKREDLNRKRPFEWLSFKCTQCHKEYYVKEIPKEKLCYRCR